MDFDKINTTVPLNSPLFRAQTGPGANPSFVRNKKRESQAKYKKDYAWMPGNAVFRRYANGMLDYEYAISKVFEVMGVLQNGGKPNQAEICALSLIVPGAEMLADRGFAELQCRLSPEEKIKLRMMFVAKNNERKNFNAGFGGGSVPFRTETLE